MARGTNTPGRCESAQGSRYPKQSARSHVYRRERSRYTLELVWRWRFPRVWATVRFLVVHNRELHQLLAMPVDATNAARTTSCHQEMRFAVTVACDEWQACVLRAEEMSKKSSILGFPDHHTLPTHLGSVNLEFPSAGADAGPALGSSSVCRSIGAAYWNIPAFTAPPLITLRSS